MLLIHGNLREMVARGGYRTVSPVSPSRLRHVPTPSERHGAEGLANASRAFFARRERSHAQGRPFFTGGTSMASTHHLPRLSTVLPAWLSSFIAVAKTLLDLGRYRPIRPCRKRAGEQRTEGSPPLRAKLRAAPLYSVGPLSEPDHEAIIRFGGEAPRRGAILRNGSMTMFWLDING